MNPDNHDIDYRYISADNHLDVFWVPPDLWQSRLPTRFRPQAPRVEIVDGVPTWITEDSSWGPSGAARVDQVLASAAQDDPVSIMIRDSALGRLEEELPVGVCPPSNPPVLLSHMDRGRIWASCIYGPVRKPVYRDRKLGALCNRAWNDYMLEMNSFAPERIVNLPNLPTAAPLECVEEVERVAALGAKGVEFSIFTAAEPVWSPVWEPVWNILEETGLVLGFHIGESDLIPRAPLEYGQRPARFCSTPFSTQDAMAQLIFCGALDRHPNLKVVFAECRVGWLEFFIEHMDRQARERTSDVKLELLPSDYWRRQIRATFEDDVVGAKLLRDPETHVSEIAMWGADYPHNPVAWPDVDGLMSWLMTDVPEPIREAAIADRACELYDLKIPAPKNAGQARLQGSRG